MALAKCKECGHEVSSKAEACPKCGYPVRNKKERKKLSSGCALLLAVCLGLLLPFIVVAVHLENEPKGARSSQTQLPAEGTRNRLIHDVKKALGSSNRDVRRVREINFNESIGFVLVRFSINDNLSDGMIESGAKRDVSQILEAMVVSKYPCQTIDINGTFPLSDQYGNSEESIVFKASYPRSVVDRINWRGFDFNCVFDIGTDVWTHPALRD